MPTNRWSKSRLLKLARSLGVPYCNSMSKQELLDNLLEAYS